MKGAMYTTTNHREDHLVLHIDRGDTWMEAWIHSNDEIVFHGSFKELITNALLGHAMNQEFDKKKAIVEQAGSFLSVIESQCQYCTNWNPAEGCESANKNTDHHPVADCIHQVKQEVSRC